MKKTNIIDDITKRLTEYSDSVKKETDKIKIFNISLKKEFGQTTIEIVLDKITNVDEVAKKTRVILRVLNGMIDNYNLNVSSSGENHNFSIEEIHTKFDAYIRVVLKNSESFVGYLKSKTDTEIILEIKDKTKTKLLNINIDDIIKLSEEVKL